MGEGRAMKTFLKRTVCATLLAALFLSGGFLAAPDRADAFCDIKCLLAKWGILRIDKLPDVEMMLEKMLETYVIQPFFHRLNGSLAASLEKVDTSVKKMSEKTIEEVKSELKEKTTVKEYTYDPKKSLAKQAYDAVETPAPKEYSIPKHILPETTVVAVDMTLAGQPSEAQRDAARMDYVGASKMTALNTIGAIVIAVNMQTDKEAQHGGVVDKVKKKKATSSGIFSISGIEDEASSYVPTQIQPHGNSAAYRAWCDYSTKKMEALAKRDANFILIMDLLRQRVRMTTEIAILGTERYHQSLAHRFKEADLIRQKTELGIRRMIQ